MRPSLQCACEGKSKVHAASEDHPRTLWGKMAPPRCRGVIKRMQHGLKALSPSYDPFQNLRQVLEGLPQEADALGAARDVLPNSLLQVALSDKADKVGAICNCGSSSSDVTPRCDFHPWP